MRGLLVRHAYLPEVTLGTLYVGELKLATLEEPWVRNPAGPGGQPLISCIPDGTYVLLPHVSPKYPTGVVAFSNPVLGVHAQTKPAGQAWGRVAVLIHAGNNTDHTEGCVLVGMQHAKDEGRHVVLQSRMALAMLMEQLKPNHSHEIHIRPTAGTAEI